MRAAGGARDQYIAAAVGAAVGSLTIYLAYKRHREATIREERAGPRVDFTTVLPEELVLQCFCYCAPQDILRVSLVCREWNRFTKDEALWKEIYSRHWVKSAEGMALVQQLRQTESWHTLLWEREKAERKYFSAPEHSDRFSLESLKKRGRLIQKKATDRYKDELPLLDAEGLKTDVLLAAIACEEFEACHALKPQDPSALELWSKALRAHGELVFTLENMNAQEDRPINVTETLWVRLIVLSCQKLEAAIKLQPLSVISVKKMFMLGDSCQRFAAKCEGLQAEFLFDKAREYGLQLLRSATDLLNNKSPENDKRLEDVEDAAELEYRLERHTAEVKRYIFVALRALGTVCLHWAERILADDREAVKKGCEKPQHFGEWSLKTQNQKAPEHDAKDVRGGAGYISDIETAQVEEEVVIILKEGRHYLMEALKLEEEDLETIMVLTDVLTILGSQVEQEREEEWWQYFEEGTLLFKKALEWDEENGEILNQYGILLTKQARKILQIEPASEGTPEEQKANEEARLKDAEELFDLAERKFLDLEDLGVWFGVLNLACLAALRDKEVEAKSWLLLCHERGQLEVEHLEDEDFDLHRQKPWFLELQHTLQEERLKAAETAEPTPEEPLDLMPS